MEWRFEDTSWTLQKVRPEDQQSVSLCHQIVKRKGTANANAVKVDASKSLSQ
jgi:hypothetical protein